MASLIFEFLLISQTIISASVNNQLLCPSTNGSSTTCTSFCGEATEETIYIGVKNPTCATMTESESGECIKKDIGCAIPWLCQILNDESKQTELSCSTADLLFNLWQLDCEILAPKIQYTNFKIQQFCCNNTELTDCSMDTDQICSHSEIYQTYSNDLYHCFYSPNAVFNKYENVTKCNDSFNANMYKDVCDFLISKTYSIYGCQCKSSYLMGYHLENEKYSQLIREWNDNELNSPFEELTKYGCASDIECIPNHRNDNVLVGGLLNIIQVLYTIECQVFVPYHDMNTSVIQHIEDIINEESAKIYVTFSERDDDPALNGRALDVFVVYFSATQRDIKYEEWTTTPEWFGDGSEVTNVETNDINQTLSYYGADKYSKRTSRDKTASFVVVIVLAVIVGSLLVTIFIYNYYKT